MAYVGATLLTVAGEFLERVGLTNPGAIYGSQDTGIRQIVRLLEEGGAEMAQRGIWQNLLRRTVFATVALEDQGDISADVIVTAGGSADSGFDFWIPDTWWDLTNKLPLYHPGTPVTWAALKALNLSGPRYTIRLRGNHLLVNPVPTAGLSWSFEWQTSFWINPSGAGGASNRFSSDADIILLPHDVIAADLKWRWKKEKGLSYAEDFNTAERMIVNALARAAGAPTLDMGGCADDSDARARIIIPGMSWPL